MAASPTAILLSSAPLILTSSNFKPRHCLQVNIIRLSALILLARIWAVLLLSLAARTKESDESKSALLKLVIIAAPGSRNVMKQGHASSAEKTTSIASTKMSRLPSRTGA